MGESEGAKRAGEPGRAVESGGPYGESGGGRSGDNAVDAVIKDGNALKSVQLDKRLMFIISCLVAMAFFMQMLDATILNTALPAIARSIGESPLRMQSVVIAYLITVALLIPASGWLADRFGAKKVFFASILIFCLGSCLCAAAWSLYSLVAARIVQGVGGAVMAPVGRLVIIRLVRRENLVQVLSFITLPGLLGPLLGPAVGGVLVQYVSWHWIFLINVPVGLLGCFFTLRFMPELNVSQVLRFDWSGFALFGLAMVALAVAFEGMGSLHLGTGFVLALWGVGLAALGGYILHAFRSDHPLFRPGIFRNRAFSVGIAGNLFSRLGSGAMPFLLPLLLQVGLGYSPAVAGLIMIPSALGAMISKSLVNKVVEYFGFRKLLVVNTLLLGCMIASFSLVGPGTSYYLLLFHLLIFGMINSFQFSIMNTSTIIDVPQADASASNSILSVVMQLSVSFGVSCGALLLTHFAPQAQALGLEGAQMGAAAASTGLRPEIIAAFHKTFICAGVFSVFASLTFFFMPKNLGLSRAAEPV